MKRILGLSVLISIFILAATTQPTFAFPGLRGNWDQSIVHPTRDLNDPVVMPRVILTCSSLDFNLLCNLTGANEPPGFVWEVPVRQGVWNGAPLTIVGPMMGAPHFAMVTEKLLFLGARMVLYLSWCGSLQSQVRIGHLVLPAAAYSGDGTSGYYYPSKTMASADQSLHDLLRSKVEETTTTWHQGTIACTDAIYRETVRLLRNHQRQGFLAMEMESALLFHLGQYRRAVIASLCVVSDELFTMHWHTGFDTPEFNQAREVAAQVILNTAAAWEE